MYRWLKAYLNEFGSDFPFSEVAELNEYEICRIIQYCIVNQIEYGEYAAEEEADSETNEDDAVVGEAIVGESKTA